MGCLHTEKSKWLSKVPNNKIVLSTVVSFVKTCQDVSWLKTYFRNTLQQDISPIQMRSGHVMLIAGSPVRPFPATVVTAGSVGL
jgi:hypothetical protein